MLDTTSSIDQFSYHPELIGVGTVYHYIKSNIDGSYPARMFIYVQEYDHLRFSNLKSMDWMPRSFGRTSIGKHSQQTDSSRGC